MTKNAKTATAADVKAWAAKHGVEVASRGALPQAVIKAYQKATRRTYVATTYNKAAYAKHANIVVTARHTQPSGRKVKVQRVVPTADARAMLNLPARGRISAKARTELAVIVSD